ncbi:hypothetical protein [Lysinibacillus sp. fls2-241-R2A-57]|uniref:hypothetical protein n=1 Tax=Lysinibacillus sp. fls2-241-R2A-57 TaxID=3040292 RepID=UPI0025575EEC|nr:hypothetical protein [Lysinibacillus sp. fls2-241-R2A-57]
MNCSFEICREILIVYRPTLSIYQPTFLVYQPTFEKYRHLSSCNTKFNIKKAREINVSKLISRAF